MHALTRNRLNKHAAGGDSCSKHGGPSRNDDIFLALLITALADGGSTRNRRSLLELLTCGETCISCNAGEKTDFRHFAYKKQRPAASFAARLQLSETCEYWHLTVRTTVVGSFAKRRLPPAARRVFMHNTNSIAIALDGGVGTVKDGRGVFKNCKCSHSCGENVREDGARLASHVKALDGSRPAF